MFKFPADLKLVREASQRVVDFLGYLNLSESVLFQIRLCFEEAFINAVKHGNKNNPTLNVNVDILPKSGFIEIVVCDEGQGFDYERPPDPTLEENLKKPSGRGIFLIRKIMDKVTYTGNGRCIHMIKKIP